MTVSLRLPVGVALYRIYHLLVFSAVGRLLCCWPELFAGTHSSCTCYKVGTGL